ncbi:MAG: alanine racemase [Candidatus Omnitrophica bacterium]|nr:alanine racemase [Candidatus Omnitrophota bacterium]
MSEYDDSKRRFLKQLSRPTWLEINLEHLRGNFRSLRSVTGADVSIMAIVKMQAYGHGLTPVATLLEKEGCTFFGVSSPGEVKQLRDVGIVSPILMLGAFQQNDLPLLARLKTSILISGIEQVQILHQLEQTERRQIRMHIKVDTGMGRLGVWYEEFGHFLDRFLKLFDPSAVEGICTHFSSSDITEDTFTELQLERFEGALTIARKKGVVPSYIHAANSAGVMRTSKSHFNLVRPGLVLYGVHPLKGPSEKTVPLREVMELKSRVTHIKCVPAGVPVSYGRAYTTPSETKLGVVPVGYADGYPRSLSGKARVLIKGGIFPVVGTICMDHIIVDLGSSSQVAVGDDVTLIGSDGESTITISETAELAGTIPYEIMTSLGKSLSKLYKIQTLGDLTTSVSLVYNEQTLEDYNPLSTTQG